MKLLDKEIATELFLKGKMPEWFYRQNYKTEKENFSERHNKIKDFKKDISLSENIINKYVYEITVDLFKK